MGDPGIFTAETAKAALNAIISTLEMEENMAKLNEVKASAGNDMLKMMQYAFPLVVQIKLEVIKKYGFSDNREGLIQFTQMIVGLEKEDPLILDLHNQVRSHYLPPITISSDGNI